MGEKKSRTKDGRTRNWTFIVYPESAPTDWREKLDETHAPFCISPLHDKDVNPDGTPKKPHWHVVMLFEGMKTYEQVEEIAKSTNGTIPQRVESGRGMVRYLAHMDNPEKAQYDKSLIEAHGGVDLADYLVSSAASEMEKVKEMLRYIVENDVVEYEDLVIYAMENETEWFELLVTSKTYFVNAFIKSRRHRREQEKQ